MFAGGISLEEFRWVAGIGKFWGEVGELRKDLVDQPDGTAEGMGMDVLCQKAADET